MGHPIRILHAVVNMNRGGAETLIMNLYRNMDRTKVQFDFLTCKKGSFDEEIEKMGGVIHRIPYVTDVGHFQYIKALKSFFAAHPDYRIVHAHMDKMSGFVLREAKQAGIPVRISHSHSISSEGGIAAKSYKWYAGLHIPRNATHLFSCSKKASEWLYGHHADQATIIKNGIDLNQFKFSSSVRQKIRNELNLKENCLTVGHVGRFCSPKNHTFIIDIFSKLKELNPNSFLIFAGDGPLKEKIEKRVKRLGLTDSVKFLGIRNDVHQWLNSFDVMLFPSLYEGLPVTLIEAQSSGLPCLISDVITDEIDMGEGFIHFENLKNDPRIWAVRLLQINKLKRTRAYAFPNHEYEITKSASMLQNIYIQAYGSQRKEELG